MLSGVSVTENGFLTQDVFSVAEGSSLNTCVASRSDID
jgi:hypothetical protein